MCVGGAGGVWASLVDRSMAGGGGGDRVSLGEELEEESWSGPGGLLAQHSHQVVAGLTWQDLVTPS